MTVFLLLTPVILVIAAIIYLIRTPNVIFMNDLPGRRRSREEERELRRTIWMHLPYFDPLDVIQSSDLIDPGERDVAQRIRDSRQLLKRRRAAVFCHSVTAFWGSGIRLADSDESGYDAIVDSDLTGFVPLKLEEVFATRKDPDWDLQTVVSGLKRLKGIDDLTVAIYQPRIDVPPEFSGLKVPKLALRQVWIFGPTTEERERWYLYGNLCGSQALLEFQLPVPVRC